MCECSVWLRSRVSVLGAAANRRRESSIPGGIAGGATPVPIPNTEVKPSWADGTALVTARESRSLPGLIIEGGHHGPLRAFAGSAALFLRDLPDCPSARRRYRADTEGACASFSPSSRWWGS